MQTPNGEKVKERYHLAVLGISLFVLLSILGFLYIDEHIRGEDARLTQEAPKGPTKALSLAQEDVAATSAYVLDWTTGKVLFEKNAEVQLPLASITKLMTAIVASELLSEESAITINEEALSAEGESGLLQGDTWQMRDLLSLTLIASSNDGALALAQAAGNNISFNNEGKGTSLFVEKMNHKAKDMGLAQTYFLNSTGLDRSEYISGAYGSAKDAVKMLEHALISNPTVLETTRLPEIVVRSTAEQRSAVNTNQTVGDIPGIIASKTGFTDLAGGNLVIAVDAGMNRPLLIAVLGSTADERFSDILTLVEKSLGALALE